MGKYNIHITVKSVIRAERIMKKSFVKFDLNNEDDFFGTALLRRIMQQ
jgi:hypothetical protein